MSTIFTLDVRMLVFPVGSSEDYCRHVVAPEQLDTEQVLHVGSFEEAEALYKSINDGMKAVFDKARTEGINEPVVVAKAYIPQRHRLFATGDQAMERLTGHLASQKDVLLRLADAQKARRDGNSGR